MTKKRNNLFGKYILTSALIFFTVNLQAQSIYRCEKNGEVSFTNVDEEARGCKRIKIVVKSAVENHNNNNPTVAEVNFPKVDKATQSKRDETKDELIRRELTSEKTSLSELEKKLAGFQITGGADQQAQIDTFKLMNEERKTRIKNIEGLEKQLTN